MSYAQVQIYMTERRFKKAAWLYIQYRAFPYPALDANDLGSNHNEVKFFKRYSK